MIVAEFAFLQSFQMQTRTEMEIRSDLNRLIACKNPVDMKETMKLIKCPSIKSFREHIALAKRSILNFISEESTSSRQMYYENLDDLDIKPKRVTDLSKSLCAYLNIDRTNFNILPQRRGIMLSRGVTIDCFNSDLGKEETVSFIGSGKIPYLKTITNIHVPLKSGLVLIEKDGILDSVYRTISKNPKLAYKVSVITGKGQSDNSTLKFIEKFEHLFDRVITLTDPDPYGVIIALKFIQAAPKAIPLVLKRRSDKKSTTITSKENKMVANLKKKIDKNLDLKSKLGFVLNAFEKSGKTNIENCDQSAMKEDLFSALKGL